MRRYKSNSSGVETSLKVVVHWQVPARNPRLHPQHR